MTRLKMIDQAGNEFTGDQTTIINRAIAADRREENPKVFGLHGNRIYFSAKLSCLADAGYSDAEILAEFVMR